MAPEKDSFIEEFAKRHGIPQFSPERLAQMTDEQRQQLYRDIEETGDRVARKLGYGKYGSAIEC